MRDFDITGPLPTGTTVLEASAGTGKTYTIAALAARYVAEGTPLERLLLVTFTRIATGELRERVRERLVGTEQGLDRVLAGAPAGDDEVVTLLSAGTRDEVRQRRGRLTRALADFDGATIATTHGFCQEVLGGLGVAGDIEAGTVLVEEVDDLLHEVVDDLYVRKFHDWDARPDFDRREALAIARAAIANPGSPIEPAAAPPGTVAHLRRSLALSTRRELEARKRRLGVMTYDDLLTRLDATLRGPGGALAAARLRARYAVVLVDEFQDTDPVQWDILRRAFGDGPTALVLIGDPKQAIYAFRGADVYAYLAAAEEAEARATLAVNWRSDQGLLDAYDALFDGAALGHEGIVHRQVRAARRGPGLAGAPVAAPLRLRVVERAHVKRTKYGYAEKGSAWSCIATDLAADVAALLGSGATVAGDPVRPGHLAVLVRYHRHGALVREALEAAGVPGVINGGGSVFETDAAAEWLALLEAIERPASAPRARAAALTPFVGWTAERVAAAGEPAWEELHRRLHVWARVLRESGVASLLERITVVERLPARMLAVEDGERALTDIHHVGQLLHAAAAAEHLGTAALTSWLRQRLAAAREESGDEERSRRLESDDEAVQILTVHRSKGLEFPVVYVPCLWEPGFVRKNEPVVFHDPQAGDVRTVDVALEGAAFAAHVRQAEDEQRGEDLRLAYVALTRAKHQAVLWWAGGFDAQHSPLGRLLFARRADGTVPSAGGRVPKDEDALTRFAALAATAPGCVSVEHVAPAAAGAAWAPEAGAVRELRAARFERGLDTAWRRTSYSAITAAAHEAWVASEPEEAALDDEPDGDGVVTEIPVLGIPSPWDAIASGTHVGTVVHAVLEATDFAAGDLDAALAEELTAARGLDLGAGLGAALRGALETPLGTLLGDLRLCDLTRADRLDELVFELPLAGGDDPRGRLTVASLARVLRRHRADPVAAAYAERLADPSLGADLRGYLTGSIDLVARLPDGRFAIIDYKTNRLAPRDEPLTTGHFAPAALLGEMLRAHYVLQGLLYLVALHRYLRWRLPGYDPQEHLAGMGYLFVRGMAGPGTPVLDGAPAGVFAWRPPTALVLDLAELLAEGGPA